MCLQLMLPAIKMWPSSSQPCLLLPVRLDVIPTGQAHRSGREQSQSSERTHLVDM